MKRFNAFDFHDDTLVSLGVRPPRRRNDLTTIIFELQDDSTGGLKRLVLHGCANLRFNADFDVLADNRRAGNVFGSRASVDVQTMRKLVRTQRSHWRTKYMPPMPNDKPIQKKLKSIRTYVLFRIKLFGGTVDVLAKKCVLTRRLLDR